MNINQNIINNKSTSNYNNIYLNYKLKRIKHKIDIINELY